MHFPKKEYYQQKFSKISLSSDTIGYKEFEDCQFVDCHFLDCTFQNCKFVDCKFTGCTLSALSPTDSHFLDIKFKNCKAIGIDWAKAQKVKDLEFTDSQINYSNFTTLDLPEIKILNSQAHEVYFTEADLSEGVFTGTDFTKSIFQKTNLTKTDFRGASNYYINPKENTITKAKFSHPEAISLLHTLDIHLE